LLAYERKEVLMSKTLMVAIILVAITAALCFADQLAWNAREICEEAAKRIRQNSILISYCSCCDNEHLEVWLVKRVIVATIATQGWFKVNIFGRRLFTSKKAFRENQYSEPVQYEAVTGDGSSRWLLEGIDLAYVYVPTSKGSFHCLAKGIKRECSINVDTISLPSQLLEQAEREVGRERKKEMLTRQ
jgi:hypothetical protein